jgi:hypothetical protein
VQVSIGTRADLSKEVPELLKFISRRQIRICSQKKMVRLDSGEPVVPQVGIFWFIQQPGASPTLLASGVPVESGERYGEHINHPGEHLRYWRGIKLRLSPFFHDCEGRDWLLGRVIYNTTTQRFDVYLNEQLQTPEFQSEILSCFNLPKGKTAFASDTHYADARLTLDHWKTFPQNVPRTQTAAESREEEIRVERPQIQQTKPVTVVQIKLTVGPGWHPIIDRLAADLLKLGWDGKVLQVKEKFGGLRFYIEQDMDVLHDRIDAAKAEAYRTCEICGTPGIARSGGWIKTLCDEHANGRPLREQA